jgi:hypothetical protein
MTAFSDLKTTVARDLRDPDNKTFTTTDLGDLVNLALVEIGRIAPVRFQEDLTPVADQLAYVLRSDAFGAAAPIPEIEVARVELWDTSVTPNKPLLRLRPYDAEYLAYSNVGWKVWDGTLELPYDLVVYTIAGHESDYLIRVWGYSPYVPLSAADDDAGLSAEREAALRAYCRVEALTRLSIERDLYTQWQTRSGNSDVSPAALMNALNVAMEDWRRRSRALTVLREAP